MRVDQYLKLQALEEKLTDAFLHEADPANWPGQGVAPKDLSQQDRGDRYWCKKNAVATISLTIRIGTLIGKVQHAGGVNPDGVGDESETADEAAEKSASLLDAEINSAEKEAKRLLRKVQEQFSKA